MIINSRSKVDTIHWLIHYLVGITGVHICGSITFHTCIHYGTTTRRSTTSSQAHWRGLARRSHDNAKGARVAVTSPSSLCPRRSAENAGNERQTLANALENREVGPAPAESRCTNSIEILARCKKRFSATFT